MRAAAALPAPDRRSRRFRSRARRPLRRRRPEVPVRQPHGRHRDGRRDHPPASRRRPAALRPEDAGACAAGTVSGGDAGGMTLRRGGGGDRQTNVDILPRRISIRMRSRLTALSSNTALLLVVLLGIVGLFGDVVYEGARSVTGPYLLLLGGSAAAVAAGAPPPSAWPQGSASSPATGCGSSPGISRTGAAATGW